MNNTPWSPGELVVLRDELRKKKKAEPLLSWAQRIVKKFTGRTPNSIRIKAAHGVEDGTYNAPPKILLLDIETLPMEVYVWGLKYNDYISHESIIKDWSIACWSAKWLFEPAVESHSVTPDEAIERDDFSILHRMWELIDAADIVVTQNGKKFDLPKLNARFLKYGFPPPMYYQVIDTKEVMSKTFGLSSNKLDYATQFLGIKGKEEMEYQDWLDCLKGGKVGQKALAEMRRYNEDDVLIMEELYVRLRPWIQDHPNLNLYSIGKTNVCPNCGDVHIVWNGTYKTSLGLYRAFRCTRCGAVGRSTRKQFQIKQSLVK